MAIPNIANAVFLFKNCLSFTGDEGVQDWFQNKCQAGPDKVNNSPLTTQIKRFLSATRRFQTANVKIILTTLKAPYWFQNKCQSGSHKVTNSRGFSQKLVVFK
ncbi:hypothetical protein C5167_011560 [Papaver somniferum]|uniref:Uncharacterized protein n=1 Tax=Papaver somniferum TaxID=3469 RepID=A0A4Y7K3B4_PAPSO|nr:hypothetical protein C5167_011560 [Papaver somniferum]